MLRRLGAALALVLLATTATAASASAWEPDPGAHFNNPWGSALFRADEQGRFEGFLPNEGPWEIGVSGSRELQFRLDRLGAGWTTRIAQRAHRAGRTG